MTRKTIRLTTGITLALLLTLIFYTLAQAFPSSEAVRLRNALLITPANARVGEWTPKNVPPEFLSEYMDVPEPIASAAKKALEGLAGSDIDKARALSGHLIAHVQDTGPIKSLDIVDTYQAIVEAGRGYCSDIVDAYVALALASGLSIRTWAFSFDGFGGHGHIVAEIFDRDTGQWVMLDVFNNVMPFSRVSGKPLSVREFISSFRSRETEISFVPIGRGRVAYWVDESLRAYYRDGLDQWYLWNGNNVVSRAKGSFVAQSIGNIFEPLGELVVIVEGRYPSITPLPSATNASYVERMLALRVRLLLLTVLCMILVSFLIAQLVVLYRYSRQGVSKTGIRVVDEK